MASRYTTDDYAGQSSSSVDWENAEVRHKTEETMSAVGKYDFNHKRRGDCLIINISDRRKGSGIDVSKLEKAFKELKFDVEIKDNLTARQIKEKLQKVAKKNHTDADCFACVLMSHGHSGYITGSDKEPVRIEDITKLFEGDVCKKLEGKPKLFFIQTCRNKTINESESDDEETYESDSDPDDEGTIPIEADFLISYATVSGCLAHRSPVEGSPYIHWVCRALREKKKTEHLLEIMTQVHQRVAKAKFKINGEIFKQMATFNSTLRKNLYFCAK